MDVWCDGRGGGEAAPGVAAAGRGRRLQVQEGQDQTPSRRLQREIQILAIPMIHKEEIFYELGAGLNRLYSN